MKCIKCNVDIIMKDRADGRCKYCRHPFVFDPRKNAGDLITDKLFEKSISLISVNNTLKFTAKQHYYFLNGMKAVQSKHFAPGCAFLIIGIFPLILFIGTAGGTPNYVLLYIGLAILAIGLAYLPSVQEAFGATPKKKILIPYHRVAESFERWAKINDPVALLLAAPRKALPAGEPKAELLDYSFDRLIVAETDEIADFLIANNFHFENNCAILSINKYPANLFQTIMKMLSNNKELKVYALHNCSWRGISILEKLRTGDDWFKDQPDLQIIDIGLLPRQLEKRPAFVEYESPGSPRPVSDQWKKSLTAKELHWLDQGNIVYLESIPPHSLIRMISMGIAMSKDPTKKDSLVSVSGDSGDTGDGGIWVYTSDSFG